MNFTIEKNRIYFEDENGKLLAELTYKDVNSNTVNINRTFVDPSVGGQGVAGKLMQTMVDQLVKENKTAVPSCSYAAKWFEKNKKYEDLVAK
ncbi:GNAT family N-acetyltransferase [Proteocatella sphenisci]|uniref:GNAT family N-acetyltransferase n=1 Tax=Proteocatella sphenisci TaxID=181070 RepID=UPI00048DC047|nr:GNAT family N-acetyltransferase [Proteocatella sphenisci]